MQLYAFSQQHMSKHINECSVAQQINSTVLFTVKQLRICFKLQLSEWKPSCCRCCCLHFLPLTATYCVLLVLAVWLPKHRVTRGALLDITLMGTHWLALLENWQTVLFIFHFSQGKDLCMGHLGWFWDKRQQYGMKNAWREQREKFVLQYKREKHYVMYHLCVLTLDVMSSF